MTSRGRESTPAPNSLFLSPAKTPARGPNTRQQPDDSALAAMASGPVGPVLAVCRDLLKQVKALEPCLNKAKGSKDELNKAVSLAERAVTAMNALDGVITKKTLQAALDATVSRMVEAFESVVSAPPNTYANAVKNDARPQDLDVVVAPRDDDVAKFRELDRETLYSRVEDALHSVPELARVTPQLVRMTAKGRIQVRVRTMSDRVLVQRHSSAWVEVLARDASVRATTYTVAVSFVPTAFNPALQVAVPLLHSWNKDVVPHPNDILHVRWLNPRNATMPNKRSSTLLVTLSDPKAASDLIAHQCRIASDGSSRPVPCPTARHIEQPVQCYRCQKFGHTAALCLKQATPSPEACARCAGPHSTKACPCTLETRCTEAHCPHLATVKCANCNGPHKSSSGQCPYRRNVFDKHARRPEFSNPYFIPNYVFAPEGAPAS